MRPDVTLPPHGRVDDQGVALDDNVLDASDERRPGPDPLHRAGAAPATLHIPPPALVDPAAGKKDCREISIGFRVLPKLFA